MTTVLLAWIDAHYNMKDWDIIYVGTCAFDCLSLVLLYQLFV